MAHNTSAAVTHRPLRLASLFALSLVTVPLAAPTPLHAQITTRVSVGAGGVEANGESGGDPAVSADGRFVAFASRATNLVANDSNGFVDIFVRDLQLGTTTLVSVATSGVQGNDDSMEPVLGAGGRLVVFSSWASNLVAGDTNGALDVFVRDRDVDQDGVFDEPGAVTTSRISVSSAGAQSDRDSDTWNGGMSTDGRYVVFESDATTLVAGDTSDTDVFVHDRVTGATVRMSDAPDGRNGNGLSAAPSISADGRLVTFTSMASNLVEGDTNNVCFDDGSNCFDVFVRDRDTDADGTFDEPGQTGTTRVSVSDGGTQGNSLSAVSVISPDGRYVAFSSWASNLVPDDTNGVGDVFVHDRLAGTTRRVTTAIASGAPDSDGPSRLGISEGGRIIVFASNADTLVPNDTNGTEDVFLYDRVSSLTTRVSVTTAGTQVVGASRSPAVSADGSTVVFESEAPDLVSADTNGVLDVFVHVEPLTDPDEDGDGLPTRWERTYGLDAAVATGANGATGDPDGDGRTNEQEYADGTHPRGYYTRYLAEGATSSFFDTRLALLNPGGQASALLRFQKGGGVSQPPPVDPYADRAIPFTGLARVTVDAKAIPGLSSAEFSTVIESDSPIVTDRLMTWNASGYGSHAESAVTSLRLTWYLAEGATHHNFNLFYLVQNPNAMSVPVTVTYLLPAPAAPLTKIYTVPAQTRFNIWVNDEGATDPTLAALAATDVSAVFTASHPILVERAMYLNQAGPDGQFGNTDDVLFNAGHESAGVTDAALSWFLAEGATGPYFDEFLLIANPTTTDAQVEARYLLGDGTVLTKSYAVPAASRFNIWVNEEAFPGLGKALANESLSATLTSTNGVPIIVERAMWWPRPSPFWMEAHNSAGTTATGTTWGLAEGEAGGPFATETYILIANTSPFAGTARVTLVLEGGGTQVVTVPLPASSRTNVPAIESWFPGITGKRFGALIESLGDTPAQIVVERAMYSDANGVHWAAGSGATATRLVP